MTISSYTKVFKQLKSKPVKLKKFIKHNSPKPRKFGKNTKRCVRCANPRGRVGQYKLNLCRRCFREIAKEIGWKKYS
ncbi:MAG: 30S ribosomal protein S14 [Nanoarchaeota archaeon]|nr:30S ribosomal protein S14 [Nanoarchaeota archaeon]